MILLIDNYDSFVHNLARYIGLLGYERKVVRNDEITIEGIKSLNPKYIILSPGPCTPNESGICLELIKTFAASIPILGVCLGHQAIGQALGMKVIHAKKPYHGKSSSVNHDNSQLFKGLPNPLQVGRYHSLSVEHATLPDDLTITAQTDDGEIMAMQHKTWPLFSVQFHPESILTECGKQILENFINES